MGYVKRFYQTNLANGEFRKHKTAYLASAVLGYLALSFACGCAPAGRPAVTMPSQQTSGLESAVENYSSQARR